MIYLVTGVPGSGKTLYSIGMIHDWLKEGRQVYSDIEGLNIEGVQAAPDDWRDTPDGAVVVYDECQQKFPADGKGGRSARGDIADMEVHRHTGHDIVLITQHPNLLHSHIRRLVGRHHHVSRMMGTNNAKIYTQDKAFKVDSRAELKASDERIWGYPKKHFNDYKSATVHTHKARIPRKVIYGLTAMGVLAIVVTGLFLSSSLFSGDYNDNRVQAPEHLKSESVEKVASMEPAVPFVGCISSAKHCRCYDESMTEVQFTEAECRNAMEKPLPRRLSGGGARSSRALRAASPSSPVTTLTLN